MANAIKFKPNGAPALENQYVRVTEAGSAPRGVIHESDTLTTDDEGYVTLFLGDSVEVGDQLIVDGDSFPLDGLLLKGFKGVATVEEMVLSGLHKFNGSSSYGEVTNVDTIEDGFSINVDVNVNGSGVSEWYYSDWGNAGERSMAITKTSAGLVRIATSPDGTSLIWGPQFNSSGVRDVLRLSYNNGSLAGTMNGTVGYVTRDNVYPSVLPTKYLGSINGAGNLVGSYNSLDINGSNFDLTGDSTVIYGSDGGEIKLFNTEFVQGGEPNNAESNEFLLSGYNIIALAGQSNMVGKAPIEVGVDDDYSNVQGVKQVGHSGVLMDAENAMDFGSVTDGSMGLWRTLVETIKGSMDDGRPILILSLAQSSSGFLNNNWGVGDDLYLMTIGYINAITQTTNSTFRGFFWHQGETDVANDDFLTELTGMWDGIKAGCPSINDNTPFVCGKIYDESSSINSELTQFVSTLDKGAIVSTQDLTRVDSLHFDAPSLREIGSRMGSAYLGLIGS